MLRVDNVVWMPLTFDRLGGTDDLPLVRWFCPLCRRFSPRVISGGRNALLDIQSHRESMHRWR